MLELTPSSVLNVVTMSTIFLIIFILLTKINFVVNKIPFWIIVVAFFIIILRLLCPIEFLFMSKSIDSFVILPNVKDTVNNIIPLHISTFILKISAILWLLIALILFTLYLYKYNVFCKKFRYIEQTKDSRILGILNNIKLKHNLNFKTKLIVNKSITAPMEFGYFSQTILIDDYNYGDEYLEYILTHELIHFKQKTNWINLFMIFINSLFWWNPVIYILRRHVDNLVEIYVDHYVTKDFNCDVKSDYLSCLLDVYKMTRKKTASSYGNFSYPLVLGPEWLLIRKRFDIVVNKGKSNFFISISMLLLLISCTFFSMKYVVQPAYQPTPEQMGEGSRIEVTDNEISLMTALL